MQRLIKPGQGINCINANTKKGYFMKKTFAKLLVMLVALGGLASCTGGGVYQPSWHYNCYPVYDAWGYYLYDDCFYEYYNNDGSITKELDLSSVVADVEQLKLEKTAAKFAEKYNLAADKGMQLAKNLRDFSALEDRTEEDLVDFAEKLYGVNPSEVVSAVGQAQVGMNAELDSVIEKAAANFNTDSANMKEIIKDLHGSALSENGIEL